MVGDWKLEATKLLASITGKHATKKRATIIALVEARLKGEPEDGVWKLPDTCSRTTYHNVKKRADGSKRGWKYDADFYRILNDVEQMAQEWQSNYALAQLQQRQEDWSQRSYEMGMKLMEKADAMLNFPLQTVTASDGKTVVVPAKWNFGTIPGLVTTADKLARLGLGMPTDVKQNLVGAASDAPALDPSNISQATDQELESIVSNSRFLMELDNNSPSYSKPYSKKGVSDTSSQPDPDTSGDS